MSLQYPTVHVNVPSESGATSANFKGTAVTLKGIILAGDTGTHQSLLEAATFIEAIENRQGLKVCCPEEIAFRSGFIDAAQVSALANTYGKTGYGEYLAELLRGEV